jgi:hypothetical protein
MTELYNFLDSNLSTDIYWGKVPSTTDFSSGVISFFRLPSIIDDETDISLASYQFSIRHTDILSANNIKDNLIDLLLGYVGDVDTIKQTMFFLQSEGEELYEEDSEVVHIPIIFNLRYVRR